MASCYKYFKTLRGDGDLGYRFTGIAVSHQARKKLLHIDTFRPQTEKYRIKLT